MLKTSNARSRYFHEFSNLDLKQAIDKSMLNCPAINERTLQCLSITKEKVNIISATNMFVSFLQGRHVTKKSKQPH